MKTIINGDDNDNNITAPDGGWVNGKGGNDTIRASDFYDIIDGGHGNDVINAKGGDDVAIGGFGDDKLYGGDGDDLIVGDNELAGGGNDLLDGGRGNDRMYGGFGDDTYIYTSRTGVDSVNDGMSAANYPGFGGGVDTLQFVGSSLDEIYFHAQGDDLVLYTSDGMVDGVLMHGIIIEDFYLNNSDTNIEYLKDKNGTTISLSDLLDAENSAEHAHLESALEIG